jgi:hypothetical protein
MNLSSQRSFRRGIQSYSPLTHFTVPRSESPSFARNASAAPHRLASNILFRERKPTQHAAEPPLPHPFALTTRLSELGGLSKWLPAISKDVLVRVRCLSLGARRLRVRLSLYAVRISDIASATPFEDATRHRRSVGGLARAWMFMLDAFWELRWR